MIVGLLMAVRVDSYQDKGVGLKKLAHLALIWNGAIDRDFCQDIIKLGGGLK